MLIGVDARFYGEAGPGRYTKNIISHLEKLDTKNKYLIFLRKKQFHNYNPSNSNFRKIEADYPWYSLEEQTLFLYKIIRLRPDLLYVPHFNIPVFYNGVLISAIPDIIMHSFSTEDSSTLPKPLYRLKKMFYYLVVRLALKKSCKVIAPSNATIDDFRKFYQQISQDKYVLAYEGVDPDLLKETEVSASGILSEFGVSKPFLLYIGSMYVHKNVKNLISAFSLLKSRSSYDGKLVIVGKKDYYSDEIERNLPKDLRNDVIMPGQKRYVMDSELNDLKKNALVYVFPSLKEGFSLTPLEAMASGLPCAVSRIPCHEEVFGTSAEYFDPTNPVDIAEKIAGLISDREKREELVRRGFETVSKYSWENTASQTLSVFKDCFKDS